MLITKEKTRVIREKGFVAALQFVINLELDIFHFHLRNFNFARTKFIYVKLRKRWIPSIWFVLFWFPRVTRSKSHRFIVNERHN